MCRGKTGEHDEVANMCVVNEFEKNCKERIKLKKDNTHKLTVQFTA